MSKGDPILPKYPKVALLGVFRKNHLIAMLQLIKAGRSHLPGSSETMACPVGPQWQELRDALEQGVFMDVFRYEDVAANRGAFIAAMASDNFDSAFSLGEDEFGIMGRLSDAMHTCVPRAGASLLEVAMEQVLPLSAGKWSEKDLVRMWNFSSTTDAQKLRFMAGFSRFMVDATDFRILPSFFQALHGIPVKYQAVRLCLVVAQISANPETECKEPRARARARARAPERPCACPCARVDTERPDAIMPPAAASALARPRGRHRPPGCRRLSACLPHM